MSETKMCANCGTNPVDINVFKGRRPYCAECHNTLTIAKQREYKKHCIDHMGGSCDHCGFNSCQAALNFHHVLKSENNKKVSSLYSPYPLSSKVLGELSKCVLTCTNCLYIHYRGSGKPPSELKVRCLAHLGHVCSKCSFDWRATSGGSSAMQFHHLDASMKRLNIGRAKVEHFARIVDEVDQCVLLCANCHSEEHYKTL